MTSRGPPLNSSKTVSGITVDPRTLDRVIPESKRSDGSVRKERKIRPGFTPQEDVARFRGTRQQAMDARTLPKGHIIGWVAPNATAVATASANASQKQDMSKAAKKNEKRREKRKEKREQEREKDGEEKIAENWDSDEDAEKNGKGAEGAKGTSAGGEKAGNAPIVSDADADAVADKLNKLTVQP